MRIRSLLIATILLVVSATLVDLNQRQTIDKFCTGDGNSSSRQPSSAATKLATNHLYHQLSMANFQQQQQDQLRDQRSPSLSSLSSSSIFCSSANSVASACIPILGGYQRCSSSVNRHQQHKQQLSQQQQQQQPQQHQQDQEFRGHNSAWFKFYSQKSHAKLQEHYEQSPHMNFNIPQAEVTLAEANNVTTTSTTNSNQDQQLSENNIRQREKNLLESVMKAARWQHCHNIHLEDGTSMKSVSGGETQSTTDTRAPFNWFNKRLLKQIFLAFSLRHSTSLIFHQSSCNIQSVDRIRNLASKLPNESILTENQLTAQQLQHVDGHRVRVSSLSSDINQTIAPTSCDNTDKNQSTCYSSSFSSASSSDCDESPISIRQRQQQPASASRSFGQTNENESIDSLHGLKFLSMIWIIVVHSYSLATRWSFFTDNSTPKNIYTSIASQLLSNGTFACDSFFFTGGFLLAYLAFPSSSAQTKTASEAATTSRPQGEGQAASLVSASHTLPVAAQPTQAEPQCQIASSQQQHQQQQQRQQQKVLQTTTDNLTVKDCRAVKSVCKQAGSSCGCDAREGTEFNGFSSPSTAPQCCCYFCRACYNQVRTDSSTSPVGLSSTCLPIASSQLVVAMAPHENHENNNNNYERNLQQQQQNQVNLITNNSNKSARNTLNVASQNETLESVKNYALPQVYNNSIIQQNYLLNTNEFTFKRLMSNLIHRYIRMMPLMMAIIGLSATLLRYLGEGPAWDNSTIMFDKWCRKNWWINSLFLHNFVNRENMCLSHSWYSAVDIQLYLIGQIILFVLYRNRRIGLLICCTFLIVAPVITATLTLLYNLPAVPLTISSVSEQSLNIYYGEIYIKPYCRAAPYLIGILLAYLMRTTSLGQVRLKRVRSSDIFFFN